MSADKKPAAKKAAAKKDDVKEPTAKQADALEEQAFGQDASSVAGAKASGLIPDQDTKPSKELLEKREELGSIPGQRTYDPLASSSYFVPDEFGKGKGLEIVTEEGRLTLKGETTLDAAGVIDLVRIVESARQATA